MTQMFESKQGLNNRGVAAMCAWILGLFSLLAAQAQAAALAVDNQGRVWQASVRQGQLLVAYSEDAGKHFVAPVLVASLASKSGSSLESRPNITVAANGNVYVSWTEVQKKPLAGFVWFARSVNAGKSFEPPYIVHQDKEDVPRLYDAMELAADGTLTLSWLDARDVPVSTGAGQLNPGAAIYFAVSRDQGRQFSREQKLADNVCECCRLATTSKPNGHVSLLWRQRFENNEQDYVMTEIKPGGISPLLVRASYGHWKSEGCGYAGTALAIGHHFGYHLAYYDAAGEKPGLRVARMDGEAWVTSPPKRFGDSKKHADQPTLMSIGERVWLAWREHGSDGDEVWAMASLDGGRTWNSPLAMLQTAGKLDEPQWLQLSGQPWLAVYSTEKGLRMLPFSQ